MATKKIAYTWEGKNKNGSVVRGEFSATNPALVRADLRRQGITPTKVKKKSKPIMADLFKPKIKSEDIAYFTRQLATMLQAGIPLVQTFDIISRSTNNPSLQGLITTVKNDVEAGSTLTEAVGKHPKHFGELYTNLINAGEQSGALEGMLDRLALYREKAESIKGKIKKALFYPVTVIGIALLITAGILIFIVPQFEDMFNSFGAELPALTQTVVEMSEIFQEYWWAIFGGIIFSVIAFVQARKKSAKFDEMVQRLTLKLPVFGAIVQKAALARYARTLETTFAAGLPLVDALTSVAGATGNIVYQNATLKIRDEVGTGQQIQVAMRTSGLFPAMVIQMIAIGEESGSLETMLGNIANIYEEQVDDSIDALSSLIEPLIMVILGVLVGGVVLAMYMPIFKMASVV